jgi:hypothetical protein
MLANLGTIARRHVVQSSAAFARVLRIGTASAPSCW